MTAAFIFEIDSFWHLIIHYKLVSYFTWETQDQQVVNIVPLNQLPVTGW